MVFACGAVHRSLRQLRPSRGHAGRRVPAALRLQLRREAHARRDPREVQEPLGRAGPLGAPVEAEANPPPAGSWHVPGAESVYERVPVRGVLQLQFVDAPVGDEDRQPHRAAALGGALDRVRRQDRQGVRRTCDRCEHARAARVHRAHHLRERVSAQLDAGAAQLHVVALPSRSATTAGCSESS
jgi:hypothetical protein